MARWPLWARGSTGEGDRTWANVEVDPKAIVLGVKCEEEALGFLLPRIEQAGSVEQMTVGSSDVVVFAVARELHAFENPEIDFERDDGEFVGNEMRWGGSTDRAEDGRQLKRLPARRLFAFA